MVPLLIVYFVGITPISRLVQHEGSNCDDCHSDVVGLRFKCIDIDCKDFDLCSYCEPKNEHTKHLLVRFGKPIDVN